MLGRNWLLSDDREQPDFIVSDGHERFGLEVSEVFTGSQTDIGSGMKRAESELQRRIEHLRRTFEKNANVTLRVRFVGDASPENMKAVIPALISADFASKPMFHRARIDLGNGLVLHVATAQRSEWMSVQSGVGWVDYNAMPLIANRVREKSTKLQRCRSESCPDVRLLLIANRLLNSGKLAIREPQALDLMGFNVVYFYSFPEDIFTFSGSNGTSQR